VSECADVVILSEAKDLDVDMAPKIVGCASAHHVWKWCAEAHPTRLNVLMKDLDAESEIEILREYAQDDGHFSFVAGVAQAT
jgi:hypothetical protein